MNVKKATVKDLGGIAEIGSENFSGLKDKNKAKKWIKCNFLAYPRAQYFVAVANGKVSGYIFWLEKGGFRNESVFELEQIAVGKDYQGQGIGTKLIEKSLAEIKKYLKARGSVLKAVEVTTGTENKAQNFYKKTLGANPECVVRNLFRGDEVVMIARFI